MVFAHALLLTAVVPLFTVAESVLAGNPSLAGLVARSVYWSKLPRTTGRILQTPDGIDRSGGDVRVLRMYLLWLDTDVSTLRERPAQFRHLGDAAGDEWGVETFLEETDLAGAVTPDDFRRRLELVADERTETVWVTYSVPFLVPVLVALVVTAATGVSVYGMVT